MKKKLLAFLLIFLFVQSFCQKINWIKVDSATDFSKTIFQNSILLKDHDSVLLKAYFFKNNKKITCIKKLGKPIVEEHYKISDLKEKYIPKSVQIEYFSNSKYFVKMHYMGKNKYKLSFKKDLTTDEIVHLTEYLNKKYKLTTFVYKSAKENLDERINLEKTLKLQLMNPTYASMEITTVSKINYKSLQRKINLINNVSFYLSNSDGGQLIYLIET